MEIGKIIRGHANNILGLNVNLKEKRMEICKRCPLYSPKLGGVCNSRLYLNPETNKVSVSFKKGYMRGCGCVLPAKTTLPDAKCIAGKW